MPRTPHDPASAPSPRLPPGLARRYDIIERVGDSASRLVFRGRERESNSPVAIEIRGADARIRADVFAAARVRGPNLAGVIEVGRSATGDGAIVSEWVPGAVSSAALGDGEPHEIVHVVIGALRGLASLHAVGLWHGALQPGNILIDRERLGADPTAVRLTGHGFADLVLSYGAPEQVASPGDPRSDLYSLGAIAYELVTGMPPHTASSPRRLIETRSRLAPRDVGERARRPVPERLVELIRALLAAKPGHRPPSAIAALARIDAGAAELASSVPRAPLGAFCVGRDRDLRELETMWEAARGGRGAAAMISGPRGIGKSRLLAELAARIGLDGGTVIRIDAERSPLLSPAIDTRRVDLEARFARPEAALRAIAAAAGDRPALIAIENTDAVDESLAELVAYIARAAASTHHLFCIATRPPAVSRAAGMLRRAVERSERGAVFDLTPLDDDSFRRVIDNAFGAAVAAAIAGPVHQACAGNPGSAAAALQRLIDRGQLRAEAGAWAVAGPVDLDAQPIDPDQPLAEALAALPAASREMVCELSVLAPAFDRDLAKELCGVGTTLLARTLADAAAAPLIIGDPAPDWFAFAPGAAERATAVLTPEQAQALHRRAADRLTARRDAGMPVGADTIARHHAQVPDEPLAVEWGLRAAEQCAASCDHRAAVSWYRRVLARLEGGPAIAVHERIAELSVILGEPAAARDHFEQALRGWTGSVEHRLGLVCRLAEAHAAIGEPRPALDLAMSALDEARQRGLTASEIRAHLAVGTLLLASGDLQAALEHAVAGALLAGARGDSATIAELGRLRGRIEAAKSDLPAALIHLDEAQRAAEQSGDELLFARVLHDLARVAIVAGDYARADAVLDRTTVIFERSGHVEPLARSLNNHGAAHYYQGRWQRAREAWERFRGLCERIDDRAELTLALNNLGSLYRDMGELRSGLDALDWAARTAEDGLDDRVAAMIVGNRGEVLARMGDYAAAADCYARALAEFERLGARTDEIETRRRLCELAISTGRINDALDRVVDVAREAKDAGNRLEEGILHRVAATALRHQGQLESAEWFCQRADEILSELGARYELAKLEAEKGELASARGDREGAAVALRRAADAFEQLEARWDLARLRARLKALNPEPGARRADAPHLLLEMAHASAGGDVDALLASGLDRVLELTQLDRGFILLLDEDGRPRQRVRRERTGAFGPNEVEFSGSIVRRVASTGESVALTDVDAGPAPASAGRRPPSVISLGLRRVMCAPMLAAGRVIGIVYVDSRGDSAPQDDRDLGLIETFAAEASAVVETARLESEVQRKGELMAILAHEIRNPLAGILGFADLGCASDSDSTRELCERIKRDGERLRRLVDNVLELARHDAGKVDWLFEPTDVAALVEEAVDTFRPACAQRKLTLEVRTSELTARARANADRIAQVLANLIGNAVKFTPPGGAIRVTARTEVVGGDDPEAPPMPAHELEAWGPVEPTDRAPGTYVRIDVSDTGPGMSEEIRSSLFQKFRQGKSGRKGKGVGLGLYISREIISRHGGSIWVQTRQGEGATFSVRLPVAD